MEDERVDLFHAERRPDAKHSGELEIDGVGGRAIGVMCGWCLAYWTGVVFNTVGESAMLNFKENKQADAGSRRFRRHFLCGALSCNFLSTEHEGLSTHVQRERSAESFMPSILSLRIFCAAVSSRCKFSRPTVCVLCFLPIHSGHHVRWTYQPGSHRRKVTQDFSSTFFMRCVP